MSMRFAVLAVVVFTALMFVGVVIGKSIDKWEDK
jgi:VIT1/CCC1 family predicted Fe2+/Mn2+ transporter